MVSLTAALEMLHEAASSERVEAILKESDASVPSHLNIYNIAGS